MYPEDDLPTEEYSALAPQDAQNLMWVVVGFIGGAAVVWILMSLLKSPTTTPTTQTAVASTPTPDSFMSESSFFEMENDSLLEQATPVKSVAQSRGLTYPISINLIGGGPMTTIDFVDGSHRNVPSGTNLIIPYRPLKTLIIRNDGQGAVQFSTTRYPSDTDARVVLNKGDSMEIKDSEVYYLNIHAPSASASVRLTGIL